MKPIWRRIDSKWNISWKIIVSSSSWTVRYQRRKWDEPLDRLVSSPRRALAARKLPPRSHWPRDRPLRSAPVSLAVMRSLWKLRVVEKKKKTRKQTLTEREREREPYSFCTCRYSVLPCSFFLVWILIVLNNEWMICVCLNCCYFSSCTGFHWEGKRIYCICWWEMRTETIQHPHSQRNLVKSGGKNRQQRRVQRVA